MDKSLEKLVNINYGFNDMYGLSYITPSQYDYVSNIITEIRNSKSMDIEDIHFCKKLFKHHYDNYYKIKELESKQPRVIAQKFISKKKIRLFIFKRDVWCLNCGATDNLSLDHINPISKGGENKLSNLQTLCKSCNSIKRDTYKDYR